MMSPSPPTTGSHRFARQDGRGHIQLVWSQSPDQASITATLDDGAQVSVFEGAFDLALEGLKRALPDGAMPMMCATCGLGFLDFFSAPGGYDDWSCFRERADLAEDLRTHGKRAHPSAFAHMNHRRVNATDVCPAFIKRRPS